MPRLWPLLIPTLALALAPALAQQSKGLTRAGEERGPELSVRAVVIGVSDFAQLSDDDDLSAGTADARLFANTLSEVVALRSLTVLTDEMASSERARQELAALLADTKRDEVALVYWKTHAAAVGRQGYLLAQDSIPEGRLPYTAMPLRWLEEQVAESDAGQVLFFFDAVHQELAGPRGLLTGPEHSLNPRLGAVADARDGVFVMTSSRPHEANLGGGGACSGHGAFTCALVDGLRGAVDLNADGLVALGELARGLAVTTQAANGASMTPTSSGSFASELAFTSAGSAPARALPERVDLCLESNGRPASIDKAFVTGDTLAVNLTVPRDGHLYIVASDDEADLAPIFPLPGEASFVSQGATVRLPPASSDEEMVFSGEAKPVELYVLWSAAPVREEAVVAMAWERAADRGRLAVNTKGLVRPSSAAQPAPQITDSCAVFTPKGDGDAWVIDLMLNHVEGPQ